jgi:acylphosphatase
VRNLPDERVECLAIGAPSALGEFEEKLRRGPTLARVDSVDSTDSVAGGSMIGFQIR